MVTLPVMQATHAVLSDVRPLEAPAVEIRIIAMRERRVVVADALTLTTRAAEVTASALQMSNAVKETRAAVRRKMRLVVAQTSTVMLGLSAVSMRTERITARMVRTVILEI